MREALVAFGVKKADAFPLHSAPHFSPFLRLFRFILLMILLLRLILCLHLVSVPPHLPDPPAPSCLVSPLLSVFHKPCIDSLCSLSVYEGRKQWDECSGHGRGSLSLHPSRSKSAPPHTSPSLPALLPPPAVVPPLHPDYVRVIRGLDMLYRD